MSLEAEPFFFLEILKFEEVILLATLHPQASRNAMPRDPPALSNDMPRDPPALSNDMPRDPPASSGPPGGSQPFRCLFYIYTRGPFRRKTLKVFVLVRRFDPYTAPLTLHWFL